MPERMQKYGLFVCLMFLGPLAPAQQATQLNVSATIPPRACEYPTHCAPVTQSTQTSVTVDDGAIRYIGSPPLVTVEDDLLIVSF